MDYRESEAYIHSFRKFTKQPGLEGIRTLLEFLGNPQEKLKCIHIAGTNGKGSTTAICASVLQAAGYKVGMFVSPYVLNFRERVQVDGQMIPEADMIRLVEKIQRAVDEMEKDGLAPAEFEVVTALGFLWFCEQGCDVVALEVGLGGRLDATNAIKKSLVSVIGAIGFDHTQILGDTLEKIAAEKCGILKPGGVCVCYPRQEPEALAEIMRRCSETDNLFVLPNEKSVAILSQDIFGTVFTYKDMTITLPLAGQHQVYNCLAAIEALITLRRQGFAITDEAMVNGIDQVHFPARFERINKDPLVVLDGAHNLQGCQALKAAMDLTGKRKIVIMGMLQDKNWRESSALIGSGCDLFIAVTPDNPRALPAGELADYLGTIGVQAMACENLNDALDTAQKKLNQDTALFCLGSLYLASEIRPLLIAKYRNNQ